MPAPYLRTRPVRPTLSTMLKPDIRSLEANDSRMWEMAFHWIWPVAWSAAHRRLANFAPSEIEDVAIDAVGDAAVEVHAGKVGSFDELVALAGVIARRRALDCVRRMQAERRAAGVTETIEGHEELVSDGRDPLEQVNAHDLSKLLTDLAKNLPTQHEELLRAYYLRGLKQSEVAAKFNMPINTVGVTLSRALESLRKELQKYPQMMQELRGALR